MNYNIIDFIEDESELELVDIMKDINKLDYESIVVYSRDWTIETIYNQIIQGNIDSKVPETQCVE